MSFSSVQFRSFDKGYAYYYHVEVTQAQKKTNREECLKYKSTKLMEGVVERWMTAVNRAVSDVFASFAIICTVCIKCQVFIRDGQAPSTSSSRTLSWNSYDIRRIDFIYGTLIKSPIENAHHYPSTGGGRRRHPPHRL